MEQPNAVNSELQIRISISANPAISFSTGKGLAAPLPASSALETNDGFRVNLEAAVSYASLSRVLNGVLAGRRFDVSEGLMATHIIVQKAAVSADAAGNMLVRVQFSGSFGGTVYLKGKPVYDATTQTLRVANMGYDLQSQSILLNTAKWMFSNKIEGELKKRTQFPLTSYFDTVKAAIHTLLNKEWSTGISGQGTIGHLNLEEVVALPEYLSIRGHCDGKLVIQVGDFNFGTRG